MAQLRIHLTFPEDRVRDPIIYEISKNFEVIPNIRRADVSDKTGWMELELVGDLSEIESTIDWLRKKGVHVDPLEKSILEG
jgi:ABC-type methionine transport system ATPase subunit